MKGNGNKKKILGIVGIFAIIVSIIVGYIYTRNDDFEEIPANELAMLLSYPELSEDDEYADDGHNVKFSAFFTRDLNYDGIAEKILGTCKGMSSYDTLYIDLAVENGGYLKNGSISINGNNFIYSTQLLKDTVLKNNYISTNTRYIELNDVTAGTEKLIMGNISSTIPNASYFSKVNYITLRGIYVDEDENEISINKTVEITVDWYGSASTNIKDKNNNTNISNSYSINSFKENEEMNISFGFRVNTNGLIVEEKVTSISIPSIAGFYPTTVTSNIDGTYDENEHVFRINNTVASDYTIVAKYPADAYSALDAELYEGSTKTYIFDIVSYSKCSNNPNEEFTNPYITTSAIAKAKVSITKPDKPIATGGVFKPYIYNVSLLDKIFVKNTYNTYIMLKDNFIRQYNSENPENIQYTINWEVTRQDPKVDVSTLVLQDKNEKGDYFNNGYYLDDCSSTKGLYFVYTDLIDDDATISVYDMKTNTLIKEFTDKSWNNFNKDNPYYFEDDLDVDGIRIEASKDKKVYSKFSVNIIREFDMEYMKSNFSRNQMEDFSSFTTYSRVSGSNILNVLTVYDYCGFRVSESNAKVEVNPTYISTENIEPTNQQFIIDTGLESVLDSYWQNGIFLIRIPSTNIAYLNLNSVTTNNETIIDGFESYLKDGYYYMRVITSSDNSTYNTRLYLNCSILANPMSSNTQEKVELYAYNDYWQVYRNKTSDIFDINENENMVEQINYSSSKLDIKAPSTFVTTEMLTDYNSEKDVNIAPNIAKISMDNKKAKINVMFANNYTSNVSDVKILGRIPFEGNSYINGRNLNSTFTTKMTSDGIVIPNELADYTTVYYSEVENASKDLDDVNNRWKTKEQLESFDNVKSYLIIVDSTSIVRAKKYNFSYDVVIPDDVEYNEEAFSCHTVYFNLMTSGGALEMSVQPCKLGFRISKFYDLTIQKLKESSTLAIKGAIYNLSYEEDENIINRFITSDSNGNMHVEDLRVNQEYRFEEVKAPNNYEVSGKNIRFKVVENSNGELEYVLLSDNNFDSDIVFEDVTTKKQIMKAKIEDVPKAVIKIKTIDADTREPISSSSYNYNGNKYLSNIEGITTIPNVKIRKDSIITENQFKGYYIITDDINFRINKEGKNVSVTSNHEEFTNAVITNTDESDLIIIEVTIENQKIPTYNMQITKVNETNVDETLEGAKFLIKGTDDGSSVVYKTDLNGNIILEDLYEFIEGKYITGKYSIEEAEAPNGYVYKTEKISFTVSKNENEELVVNIENRDNLNSLYDVTVNGNTVNFIIADKPLFKLTKTDLETGLPLANVEFVLYELDSNGNQVDFAKDPNGNYIGTLDESGNYIVRTDENGVIIAPLGNGTYKAVETKYLEGYQNLNNSDVFTVTGNADENEEADYSAGNDSTFVENEIILISKIEDFVNFGQNVISGNNYSKKIVVLTNDIDFADRGSYRNPDEIYVRNNTEIDLNGNGTIETIFEELNNKENGKGFPPMTNNFGGVFNGGNHEIKNLYMNREGGNVGLFAGGINNGLIQNLGITGEIIAKNATNVAVFLTGGYNGIIDNCYNKANIIAENCSNVAGISLGYTTITNCYNTGNIYSKSNSNSGVYGISYSYRSYPIENCYNAGTLELYAPRGNIYGISGANSRNCYNIGNLKSGKYDNQSEINENIGIRPIGFVDSNSYSYYLNESEYVGTFTAHERSIAKTSEEMKSSEFISVLSSDSWILDTENINSGYPILDKNNSFFVKEINYIEDLVKISERTNNYSCDYSLGYKGQTITLKRDLDFEDDNSYKNPLDTSHGDINKDGVIEGIKIELTKKDNNCGFQPISRDNSSYGFSGTFDGNNKELKNIFIGKYKNSYNSYLGLFGYGAECVIRNLTISGELKNVEYAGGFVGQLSYGGKFENCINKCNFNATRGYQLGGIIGYGYNGTIEIKNCKNYGNVLGNDDFSGGIVGYISGAYSNISNCQNYGKITGRNDVGGIIGYGSSFFIQDCENYGEISSTSYYLGGIAGYLNSGVIRRCSNNCEIRFETNNGDYYGGIIGYLAASCLIENCYNTKDITVIRNDNYRYHIGGILGYCNQSTIHKCWNSGNIEGRNNACISGILGEFSQYGTIKACYNTGSLKNTNAGSEVYIGGILAIGNSSYSSQIVKCYNIGKISLFDNDNENNSNRKYVVGGIFGQFSNASYSYNKGDIEVKIKLDLDDPNRIYCPVGGITGYGYCTYSYNTGNIDVDVEGTDEIEVDIGGIGSYIASGSNLYNTGNITERSKANKRILKYVGGISGNASSYGYTNNSGNIICKSETVSSGKTSTIKIGGISGSISITGNNYNTGKIDSTYIGKGDVQKFIGGVTGDYSGSSSASIGALYNTGNIKSYCNTSGTAYINLGGVSGYCANLSHCYNTGNISNYVKSNATILSKSYVEVGGIVGNAGKVNCAYNIGNISNEVADTDNTHVIYTGPIVGKLNSDCNNIFYLENIKCLGKNEEDTIYGVSETEDFMKSNGEYKDDGMFEILSKQSNYWLKYENQYPTLKMNAFSENNNLTELNVFNFKKKFDITTEVGKNEKGVTTGGTLSGNYNENYSELLTKKLVEVVTYDENSTKDIEIIPNEGYEIVSITINDENYEYEADSEGKVVIPAGYFTNVQENYNVKATFGESNSILKIKKVDENNNPIEGAIFKIEQVDDRTGVTDEVKSLVSDEQEVTYANGIYDPAVNYNDTLGTIEANGTYYFTSESDGTYKSNNNSQGNTTANSYFEIDLTNKEGTYLAVVNANVSSESNYDFGFATITDNTNATSYNDSNTKFIYISGNVSNQDYTSKGLLGGNKYYLHLGYRKDGGGNSGSDTFTINSINIYKSDESTESFSFQENDGKYVSNNNLSKPVATIARGYVPIDLRNTYGKYLLKVNGVKVGNGNAYMSVTDSIDDKAGKENKWVDLDTTEKDYKYFLEGGQMYYLHFAHENNTIAPTEVNNYATINSVSLELADGGIFKEENIKTNSKGEIIRGVKYRTYKITETSAPEGYSLNPEVITHTVTENSNNTITVVNQTKKIVNVHYYQKGTGPEYNNEPIKVADDLKLYGDLNSSYTTTPRLEIGEFLLVKENGEYKIPVNASGVYTSNEINVYYYYEKQQAEYTVKYLYNNVEDEDKKETETVELGTVIDEYEEKAKDGYVLEKTENFPLTVSKDELDNIIVVKYVHDVYKYTVHYFYDGIEDEDEKVEEYASYEDTITSYENKIRDGFVLDRVKVLDNNSNEADLPLSIKEDESKNVINVYYKSIYNISTEVVEHVEKYSDDSTKNVKGGTITGESLDTVEAVVKGENSQTEIEITPDIGYMIQSIIIKEKADDEDGESLDVDELLLENGSIKLNSENGYFTNVSSDKHIVVEFRKIVDINVKYMIKDTDTALTDETIIHGYDGMKYEAVSKVIKNYTAVKAEITALDSTPLTYKGTMIAENQTLVFWYEWAQSGILVRHIAITEEDIENGLTLDSGTVIEEEALTGNVETNTTTNRKTFEKYIVIDGPVSDDEDIIVAGKDENSKELEFVDDKTIEVRYYYERQYDITLETKEHEEEKEEAPIKGGHIEGEEEKPYETVPAMGENKKKIEIVPDEGYRVKTILVNDEEIDLKELEEDENHKITIPEGYFTKINEEKNVEAEFERIPAKVIVKYVDVDTKETLDTKEITGVVGDEFKVNPKEIKNYKISKMPETLEGKMTEKDIEITFECKKLFSISIKIVEYEEKFHKLIELPKDSDQEITSIKVKGGTIVEEDDDESNEVVERGADSKNNITLKADEYYRISSIKVNGKEIKITNDEEFALEKFKNVQEDVKVEVKFERQKGTLKVEYLEKGTNKAIAKEEVFEGQVPEEYKTYPKEIEGYKLVDTSKNKDGKIAKGDNIVKYYYEKIEEPKKNEPKQEEKEEPKKEEPKQEEKAEEPKTEEPKQEEKAEEPKAEEPKQEEITEEPKKEEGPNNEQEQEEFEAPNFEEVQLKNNSNDVKTGDKIISQIIILVLSTVVMIYAVIKRK